ncbi:SH3 domain-containing protein [Uliginosibacterium paludis]|uniref:SH3 domain-containing protein n=1 Tax=Uliginosibacterium paludis TaxID=1615952 RepID=A0ABV2CU88_9RHOO
MNRQAPLLLSGTLALLTATSASALEYKSLVDNAIVYDACSTKARPVFILRHGTPVEVIVSVDKWVKIREQGGGLGCLPSETLGNTRQVIVTASSADVLQKPEQGAPAAFSVAKDVILEAIDKPDGAWLKVRHSGGQSGYIPLKSVWGI